MNKERASNRNHPPTPTQTNFLASIHLLNPNHTLSTFGTYLLVLVLLMTKKNNLFLNGTKLLTPSVRRILYS
jgi:hypothetical protein